MRRVWLFAVPRQVMAVAVVAGGLSASLLSVPSTATGVAASAKPVTAVISDTTAAPTEAPNEATALALAARYRSAVEILEARTESTQTFAQPDGTLRLRQSLSPQRVRQGSGWVPVNTALTLDGDAVRPQAATLDMTFSGGGSAPMVTIASGARTFSMLWPDPLPVPELLGDTATYAEVLPGVDLKLTASVDSFSEVLVVKTPQAARNPQLASIKFSLQTQGVAIEQDKDSGFIRVVDPSGAAVFVSDGAQMWDSPEVPAAVTAKSSLREASSGAETLDEPSVVDVAPARTEEIPVKVSPEALTLSPSVDMLSHPQTNFPVYIDPGFTGDGEIWTPVSRKNPSTSYWSGNGYRDEMRVGQSWQSSADDDWRTLAKFDVTKLKKTKIISAGVFVNVWHTANCSPSPFQLWRTNAISKSAAVTWNSTKNKTWKRLAEVNATANKQSCPKGNDEVAFKQAAVKAAFQDAADKNYASITFAFKAKSEADDLQWKKLKPGSAYLEVVYNHRPGLTTGVTVSPCMTCTVPIVTSSRKPKLTMAVKDADGGKLRYEYRVYDSAKEKIVASGTNTGVASGATRSWTVTKPAVKPAKVWPGLADGTYHWIGRGCDSYQCGPWTSDGDPVMFKFVVDTTNPKAPKITSDLYSQDEWKGGVGQKGNFTFTPGSASDGVSKYTYALNGGTATTVTPNADGTKTVAITPKKDSANVLTVKAIDKAGNLSGEKEFEFWVDLEADSWYWSLDEGTGTTADSLPINNRQAGISGSGVTWSPTGMSGSAGSGEFAGTGELTTPSTVLTTTGVAGFTVASWVRLPAPDAEDAPPAEPEVPDTGEEDDPGTGGGDDPDSEESPPDVPDDAPVLLPPDKNQTSISEDGTKRSMFRLGYRRDLDVNKTEDGATDPAWCFTIAAADSPTAAETAVCTTEYVVPGEWTHLVGVVDPLSNQIRLYVNGTPAVSGSLSAATGKALWDASGVFAIGRGYSAGAAERWVGGIDEVRAVPRVWTAEEIDQWAAVPLE